MVYVSIAVGKRSFWDYLFIVFVLFFSESFIFRAFLPWSFDETGVWIRGWLGFWKIKFYEWKRVTRIKESPSSKATWYLLVTDDGNSALVQKTSFSKKDLRILSKVIFLAQKHNPGVEISPGLLRKIKMDND